MKLLSIETREPISADEFVESVYLSEFKNWCESFLIQKWEGNSKAICPCIAEALRQNTVTFSSVSTVNLDNQMMLLEEVVRHVIAFDAYFKNNKQTSDLLAHVICFDGGVSVVI